MMADGKRKISFGLWYDFRNPAQWWRSDKEIYDATIEQISWAETIGYEDVWLTEHHFVDDGHAPRRQRDGRRGWPTATSAAT